MSTPGSRVGAAPPPRRAAARSAHTKADEGTGTSTPSSSSGDEGMSAAQGKVAAMLALANERRAAEAVAAAASPTPSPVPTTPGWSRAPASLPARGRPGGGGPVSPRGGGGVVTTPVGLSVSERIARAAARDAEASRSGSKPALSTTRLAGGPTKGAATGGSPFTGGGRGARIVARRAVPPRKRAPTRDRPPPIHNPATATSFAGIPPPLATTGKRFCSQCGHAVAGKRFCNQCGHLQASS